MDSTKMKITIIYDNQVFKKGLKADWGFASLIEINNRRILFDTGADGTILLYNMKKLNIEPRSIEEVFISHSHWDHTGGLTDFLKLKRSVVYIPFSWAGSSLAKETIKIKEPTEIDEDIYSTGELLNIEQSLVVKTEKGLVIIAGCSHPGVGKILQSASQFGKPLALIGGLHGFREFDLLNDLELVCATHCTQFKSEIKSRFTSKYIEGGAGQCILL